MSRIITAWLADTHAGHRLGLCPPDITVYDEDITGQLFPRKVSLTATQEMLWDAYTTDIQSVVDLANGDPIYVFHCGDLTQGVKHKAALVSTRVADQITIARHNMEQWLQIPNVQRLELVVGTAAHLLGEASTPVLLHEILAPKWPDTTIDICYHHRPTIEGAIFDAAHHGPSSGIREWTQGNQLRYYARSIIFHDILRARHPPNIIFRAHFHRLWPETVHIRVSSALLRFLHAAEDHRAAILPELTATSLIQDPDHIRVWSSDIILLPSYCGLGEYGRQATGSSPTLSIGTVAVEIIDGQIADTHFFEREYDVRREETL